MRELDTTSDAGKFASASKAGLWPVYKGESFNLWDPDAGRYLAWADPDELQQHLHQKRLKQAKNKKGVFYGADPNWVNNPDTLPCLYPRIAYRGTAGATNQRTAIVCLLPPQIFLVNSAPYIWFPPGEVVPTHHKQEAHLLGVMASAPFDWYLRRVVVMSFTKALFGSLPILRYTPGNPLDERVIEISGRLAAVDSRYADWADKVGVPVGSANESNIKDSLIAELDAAVGLLYGLDEDNLRVVWKTFHPKTDHLPKLDEVLEHHRKLSQLR